MLMKRTIWVPVMIGVVAAILILLVAEAAFVIPLGNNYSIGIGEIFNVLSAALGGPIAIITTLLLTSSGHYIFHFNLYTNTQFAFIALADALVHICAMLVVAIIYYRFLYPRVNRKGVFIVGWWLTIGVYYYIALLPLQVVLLNYADPGFGATFPSFARIFLPEFLGTATITTLIWLAVPVRYHRPQWVESKNSSNQAYEGQNEQKDGVS